ncbi:hypothetical protein ABFY67_01210 [Pseudomonas aeruginosa]|uniref:hypothetical protein n=1 Tax=Pseudomonas aeruginosa TaxID=287 RepID=UPI003D2B2FA4
MSRYDFQQQIGGQYLDNVGDFQGVGVIARWKHVANATWSRDAWQRTLSNRYTSGYNDYDRASPRQGRLVEPLGPGRQLPPQPRAGANPRGEEPVRPRTAVQQPDLHLPERLRPRYTDPYGRILFGRLSYSF